MCKSYCLVCKIHTKSITPQKFITSNNRVIEISTCSICDKNKSKLIGKGFYIHNTNQKVGFGTKKKNDKSENFKAYCGIKKVPKSRRLGTMKDCAKSSQIRYWGINKVDERILSKQKKKPIKRVKLSDKKVQPSSKIKAPKKDISSSKTDNIKIQKLKTNENVIKMFNDIWYIHPKYTGWAVNKSGDVLFIAKRKILKPKMTPEGMVVNVSSGHGFKLYPVQNLVYEAIYDIENLIGKIKHIDGNIANNSISNLEWIF